MRPRFIQLFAVPVLIFVLGLPHAALQQCHRAPTPVDILNLVWAGVSVLLSGVACLVCFERPRSHREELFETDHPGSLTMADGTLLCRVHRLSTVDADIRLGGRQPRLRIGTAVDLAVEGLELLKGHVAQHRGRKLMVSLALPEERRRALVVALYGRPNNTVPQQANMRVALGGLIRRAVGGD